MVDEFLMDRNVSVWNYLDVENLHCDTCSIENKIYIDSMLLVGQLFVTFFILY